MFSRLFFPDYQSDSPSWNMPGMSLLFLSIFFILIPIHILHLVCSYCTGSVASLPVFYTLVLALFFVMLYAAAPVAMVQGVPAPLILRAGARGLLLATHCLDCLSIGGAKIVCDALSRLLIFGCCVSSVSVAFISPGCFLLGFASWLLLFPRSVGL